MMRDNEFEREREMVARDVGWVIMRESNPSIVRYTLYMFMHHSLRWSHYQSNWVLFSSSNSLSLSRLQRDPFITPFWMELLICLWIIFHFNQGCNFFFSFLGLLVQKTIWNLFIKIKNKSIYCEPFFLVFLYLTLF